MNTKIIQTKKTDSKASLIMIIGAKSKIDKSIFSKQEYDYLIESIKNDTKVIHINQYQKSIFIIVKDESKKDHQASEYFRKKGASIYSALAKSRIEKVQLTSVDHNANEVTTCAEGILLASYSFTRHISKKKDYEFQLKQLTLVGECIAKESIVALENTLTAVFKARDLINEPVNHLNATQLSREFQKMGKEAGFSVQVLEKRQIQALRMGGLLSVNMGSIDPPTFTIMEWKPKNAKNKKPLVLVGKGVVYDSGGLSIKPTQDSMDYMKSDMSGAAAVGCTMYALAKNKFPAHVIALVPATDNRPGGNAYAPGDIIKMYDGSTVEMLNSDAEGRMILADAIAYSKKYNPELIINLATLTGSASVAVGPHAMVAMSTADASIMNLLKEAGDQTYERMVEFPLWDEYGEMIKSDIADVKNVGGRSAGAITAGKFLERFAPAPFVHLDIAGVAFNKSANAYLTKGGSGVGIRLLLTFISLWQNKVKK